MTEAQESAARAICAERGYVCPDPGMHVIRSDGSVGLHAWVMQAIKDAKSAAE